MSKTSIALGLVTFTLFILINDRSQPDQPEYKPSRLTPEEYAAIGDPEEASIVLNKIAGVYKYRFQNEDMEGNKYESEDVIKVEPIDEVTAHVDLQINGFNGHGCEFKGSLVYTPKKDFMYRDPSRECAVTMKLENDSLIFGMRTEENCFCGSRMDLRGYSIEISRRKGINQSRPTLE